MGLRSARLLSAVCLAFGIAPGSPAPSPRPDGPADPLPTGALARLGSIRFRVAGQVTALRYADGGKNLLLFSSPISDPGNELIGQHLHGMDAAAGKELFRRDVSLNVFPFGKGGAEYEPARWCVSPDGRLLAEADEYDYRGQLRIRDLRADKVVRALKDKTHRFTYLQFSPDGNYLAAVEYTAKQESSETTLPACIRLWEAATGKEVRRLTAPVGKGDGSFRPLQFAFSPDGKLLAAVGSEGGQEGVIRLWHTSGKGESWRLRGHAGSGKCVAFAPDGKTLAEVGRGKLRLWDALSGKQLKELAEVEGATLVLAFAPDGKVLARAGAAGSFRAWEVAGGKELPVPRHSLRGFVFSSDGKTLAVGQGEGLIHLLDARTGKLQHTLRGWFSYSRPRATEENCYVAGQGMGWSLAFSPDGATLAAATVDGPVRRWATANGKEIPPPGGGDPLAWAVAFSPDGRTVASVTRDGVSLWDAGNGHRLNFLRRDSKLGELAYYSNRKESAFTVVFSSDGKRLATGAADGVIALWDVATGKRLWARLGHPESFAVSLTFAPDDKTLVSGGCDGRVVWWDTATGKPGRTFAAVEPVPNEGIPQMTVVLSAGARTAASYGWNGVTKKQEGKLWELATGKPRRDLDSYVMAFSPDGQRLAQLDQVVNLGAVTLVDAASGETLRSFGEFLGVSGLAFSPGGKLLAVAHGNDGAVRVWDTATGKMLRRLAAPPANALAVAFSPDGGKLASSCDDTSILVWDVSTFAATGRGAAPSPEELNSLWRDLSGADAGRAGKALARLISSPHSVPFLKEKLSAGQAVPELLAVRAVELLERIGTADAVALLESLARLGPDSRLTREAKDSLRRRQGTRAPAIRRPDGSSAKNSSVVPLPPGSRARIGSPRFQHGLSVHAVRYAPDGKTLWTTFAASDRTHGAMLCWEADTGRLLRRLDVDLDRFSRQHSAFDKNIPEILPPGWCVSRDSRLLVTIGDTPGKAAIGSDTIHVQDLDTGKVISRVQGEHSRFMFVQLSPDGKTLAAADVNPDGLLRLFETASGKEIGRLSIQEGEPRFIPIQFHFSPDEKTLAAVGNEKGRRGVFRLWDVAGPCGPRRLAEHSPSYSPLAFSPDGKALAVVTVTGDGRPHLCVWDSATGKRLRDFGEHPAAPDAVTFSPDGKWLASLEAGRVRLWNASNGKGQPPVVLEGASTLLFSPDGKTFALGNVRTIHLCDAVTGKRLHKLERYAKTSWLRYDAGGEWDTRPRGAEVFADAQQGIGGPLAFSPDGTTLAAADQCTVRRWSVETGREIAPAGPPEVALAVTVTRGGKVTAFGLNEVWLWDGDTGRRLATFSAPRDAKGKRPEIYSAALSPDEKLLAAGTSEGDIFLWDVVGKKPPRLIQGHKAHVYSLAWEADGRVLRAGSHDGAVAWWDVATGRALRRAAFPPKNFPGAFPDARYGGGPEQWRFADFSPDGRLWALVEAEIVVLELASGKPRLRIPTPERCGPVYFSPDGRYLAGATLQGSVKLFDALTGEGRGAFTGLSFQALVFAFSPDGKLLAAVEAERVRVWEIESGKVLGRLGGHLGPVVSVAFSPDGRTLVTSGMDTTLLFWDVHALRQAAAPAGITARELATLWDDLASADAAKGYAAMRRLAGHPAEAVALLKGRLKPAAPPDENRLARLIADLGSNQSKTRSLATDELAKLGESAGSALRKCLAEDPPLEVRRRVEGLLARLDRPVTEPDLVRALRAVELLEWVGNAEARVLLRTLAGGAADVRLTREAQASLLRLDKFRGK